MRSPDNALTLAEIGDTRYVACACHPTHLNVIAVAARRSSFVIDHPFSMLQERPRGLLLRTRTPRVDTQRSQIFFLFWSYISIYHPVYRTYLMDFMRSV